MDLWSLLFWKGFMQDPEKSTSRMHNVECLEGENIWGRMDKISQDE
jgi:hypothetical protein